MGMVHTGEQMSFADSLDFWRVGAGYGDAGDEGAADDLRLVIAVLADDRGVDPERIRLARGLEMKGLRHVAIYLTHCIFSRPMAHIGRLLGLSKQAVSKCLRRIEDLRDDAEFDRWMCDLELKLEMAAEDRDV